MLVEYTFENHVARIRLNRPEKRNAISRQLLTELLDAIDRADAEVDNRLTIIAANGSAFCAGMDLAEMQNHAESSDMESAARSWHEDSARYRDMLIRMLNLKMPVVCALRGPAVAGGLGIVLACDLVVADSSAILGLPEPKRGIVAGMVAPLVIYRAGVSAAHHALLSMEMIDAEAAVRLNLIHVLTDNRDFESRLEAYCQSILSGGPQAVRTTKQLLGGLSRGSLIAELNKAADVSAVARGSDEAREGLAAFLEKRDPLW